MLLEVEGLSKRYQRGDVAVDALAGVGLTLGEGDFVTITGPSGSGKTTLLLTVAGLLKPDSGRIRFQGQALEGLSDAAYADVRRRRMGFVMQSFSLVPYLTALENVTLPLAICGVPRAQQGPRARALLERVGLSDRARHLPRELSAGQQQRVAIARALANQPALVLADEPTGNLDPALATDVLSLLQELNREHKTALLLVTHSPEAAAAGTRTVRLVGGRTR